MHVIYVKGFVTKTTIHNNWKRPYLKLKCDVRLHTTLCTSIHHNNWHYSLFIECTSVYLQHARPYIFLYLINSCVMCDITFMPFLIHVWILDVYDCAWSVIPNKKNNQKRKRQKYLWAYLWVLHQYKSHPQNFNLKSGP